MDLVERLEPILRAEIRKDFGPQSCIESSVILSALLQDAGVRAWPFPVETCVMNPPYVACYQREGPPLDQATFDRWHDEDGAWQVWIGRHASQAQGTWPGHLVLVTEGPDGVSLWDPSIDQASVPGFPLALPELLVLHPLPDGFEDGAVAMCDLPDGTQINYKAQVGATRTEASAWPVDTRKVASVLARIRARLGRG